MNLTPAGGDPLLAGSEKAAFEAANQ